MKYGRTLVDGDVDYRALKSAIDDGIHAFVDAVRNEVARARPSVQSYADVTRNYLAIIKAFKKFDKRHKTEIGGLLPELLIDCPWLEGYRDRLTAEYERRYPQYHYQVQHDVLVVAHRGLEPYASTVKTGFQQFRYACDYVEVDVCRCGSGEIILQHDVFTPTGALLSDCDGPPIGSVLLSDLLSNCWVKKTDHPKLMIDVKGVGNAVVEGVCRILQDTAIPSKRILLASFSHEHIAYLCRSYPEYPRALITANTGFEYVLPNLLNTQTTILITDENSLDKAEIAKYASAGVQVWSYTVNKKVRLNTVLGTGVAAVISDFPNLLTSQHK